ncbi:MAG: sulfatase-like hydrolase/transferase [Bacteroidales bacterium]|nr:sulfatase-like hydrolase/transferase [Bacteroidales bacterium]
MRKISILPGMCLLLAMACSGSGQKEQPNFVWIISEDNSVHYMELFDPGGIATPHIARMAEEGIRFTRAFSNAPVCSVARSTLISSCYGPRTGAQYHRRSTLVPMPEGLEMFPAYLKRAGYYTTNNSKEDYNYIKNEGVWDESSGTAHWSNREPGQPFFHKESHPVSHESRLHFKAELMESYHPLCHPDSIQLFPNHPDTDLFRFTSAYYRDKILGVDNIVGGVIRKLEEEDLLESTFVFYFGDHGGVLPGSKGYLYETGLHVPLVVRIPKKFRHLTDLKRGEASDGFVSFIDLGPTLLKLAGIEIPGAMDGVPFLGEGVSAEESGSREITYGYADRFDEKYDLVRTVRRGDLKYMRSYQPFNVDGLQNNYRYLCLAYEQWRDMYRAGELNPAQAAFFEPREPEALYDLAKDPFETRNLAGDPAFSDQLSEMRALLAGWEKGMPDLSFYPENYLRKHAFGNPVLFGEQHKADIGHLIDIANLELLPYEEARSGIIKALDSEDPFTKYWGLIVCSAFGSEAGEFRDRAGILCKDADLLVRTRAAEFLGLTGLGDPVPVILDALYGCCDGVEALLILNSLVLLRDGPYACHFELDEGKLSPLVLQDQQVQRRLGYIHSRPALP